MSKPPLKIELGRDGEFEELVVEDLENFNTYFQKMGNAPISPYEVAILKTYLYYKVKKENGSEEEG